MSSAKCISGSCPGGGGQGDYYLAPKRGSSKGLIARSGGERDLSGIGLTTRPGIPLSCGGTLAVPQARGRPRVWTRSWPGSRFFAIYGHGVSSTPPGARRSGWRPAVREESRVLWILISGSRSRGRRRAPRPDRAADRFDVDFHSKRSYF